MNIKPIHTTANTISPHGALIFLLDIGQVLYVANLRTRVAAECTVAHVGGREDVRI